MKKAQKDIIRDLQSYRSIFEHHAREERKRYYLEENKFFKDMRFHDFLKYKSKLHVIEDILGVPETKIEIVIV